MKEFVTPSAKKSIQPFSNKLPYVFHIDLYRLYSQNQNRSRYNDK